MPIMDYSNSTPLRNVSIVFEWGISAEQILAFYSSLCGWIFGAAATSNKCNIQHVYDAPYSTHNLTACWAVSNVSM